LRGDTPDESRTTIPGSPRRGVAAADRRRDQRNAYTARLAERAGFRALYVSGAGVANASFGLPDLGFTTLDQVAEDVRRIAGATKLPLLVDIDTGWEDDLFTGRTMNVDRKSVV